MDPYIVRVWQVWPWLGASVFLSLIFGRRGALCVALLSAVAALAWALLVERSRRERNAAVSVERLQADAAMDANGLLAFGPAIALSVAIAAVDLDPVVEPAWTAIALGLPLLAILVSSAIDWYVVLPFRDGVVGLPACRIEAVDLRQRRRRTKLWVAHRLICELSIATSLLVAAILVVHHYAHDLGPIVTILGALGISAAAGKLAWDRWAIGGLRFCLRQGPALGNWVSGPSFTRRDGEKTREGFVLDVSLDNGLKVVAEPGGTEYFIALKDAVPDISVKRSGYGCREGDCRRWLGSGHGPSGEGVSCEIDRLRRESGSPDPQQVSQGRAKRP